MGNHCAKLAIGKSAVNRHSYVRLQEGKQYGVCVSTCGFHLLISMSTDFECLNKWLPKEKRALKENQSLRSLS